MRAVLARSGRRAPKLSLLLCSVPSPHGTTPLHLRGDPGGHLAPESQDFQQPRAHGSLPRSGASPSSSKEDTGVSLTCLALHPSFCCLAQAPAPARCGAAVCLFGNWDCWDAPEDKQAQGRIRKAAARSRPTEMQHLLHLFLFCWYFNLSAKTNSRIWFDLLCFLQILNPPSHPVELPVMWTSSRLRSPPGCKGGSSREVVLKNTRPVLRRNGLF